MLRLYQKSLRLRRPVLLDHLPYCQSCSKLPCDVGCPRQVHSYSSVVFQVMGLDAAFMQHRSNGLCGRSSASTPSLGRTSCLGDSTSGMQMTHFLGALPRPRLWGGACTNHYSTHIGGHAEDDTCGSERLLLRYTSRSNRQGVPQGSPESPLIYAAVVEMLIEDAEGRLRQCNRPCGTCLRWEDSPWAVDSDKTPPRTLTGASICCIGFAGDAHMVARSFACSGTRSRLARISSFALGMF